jgi:hypothetical protein
MSAILSVMTVSTRTFLRNFGAFRKQAERGEVVVIQTREGSKFAFQRTGAKPRPGQVQNPLPKSVTDKWHIESSGAGPEDWEMNG